MTRLEIFHTVIIVILGVVSLCEVKGAKKPRKYISLVLGIFALLVALYDILVHGIQIL